MTINEFWTKVGEQWKKTKLRYGQCCFNLLHDVRLDLANQVRGTDKDPFYVEDKKPQDERMIKFIDFITKNW